MKSKESLVKYLLENHVDEYGDIIMLDLDFHDFKGDIYQGGYKCNGSIFQDSHKNEGNIYQTDHKNKGSIFYFDKQNTVTPELTLEEIKEKLGYDFVLKKEKNEK